MRAYLARRLAAMVPIVILVGTIVFLLIHLTPGDPAVIMLGPDAPDEAVTRLRQELGLDAPLLTQWFRWFQLVLVGDLGTSIFFGLPVTTTIRQHLLPRCFSAPWRFPLRWALGCPRASSRRCGGAR